MANYSSSLAEYQLPTKLPTELNKRKLIGLGEVVHGSGGLHKLAGNLIQKMVVDFNVRTILFEAPQGAVAEINEHIVRGEPIPASAPSDLYFVWRSQDNLRLFNNLSEMNWSLKDKVQLIGIDIRQPASELATVREYLKKINKSELLKEFPLGAATIKDFAEYERNILAKKMSLSADLAIKLTDSLAKISAVILADKTKSKEERSSLALAVAKLKAWVKTYKFLGREEDYSQGFLARDEGMAEVAKSYLKNDAGSPTVIWAHLGHLAFNNLTIQSSEEFFSSGKLLGALLRQKLGSDYSLIAVMSKRTGVTTANGQRATFEAKPNSLESKASTNPDEVRFIGPDELKASESLTVGDTSNAEHPGKQTYFKLTMGSLDQFDYAAIVCDAEPMNEAR